jgi:hypothetical protein
MQEFQVKRIQLPDLPRVSKEIYTTFFPDCDCPRTLSLIEEVYRPFTTEHLNLRHHLLDDVILELRRNHVNSVQAVLLYMRIVESHNFNLFECQRTETSDDESNAVNITQIITDAFEAKANDFQINFERISLIPRDELIKQPRCYEELSPLTIKWTSE